MKCEEVRDWLTSHLLNDLEESSSAEIKAHLSECEGCRAEACEIGPTLGLLREALAAPTSAPRRLSPKQRARVLAAGAPRKRGVDWFTAHHVSLPAVAAVLVMVFILAGLLLPSMQFCSRTGTLGGAVKEEDVILEESRNGPAVPHARDLTREKVLEMVEIAKRKPATDDESKFMTRSDGKRRLGIPSGGSVRETEPESGVALHEVSADWLRDSGASAAAGVPPEIEPPEALRAELSPQPAAFDSVAIVKSPMVMRGAMGSRTVNRQQDIPVEVREKSVGAIGQGYGTMDRVAAKPAALPAGPGRTQADESKQEVTSVAAYGYRPIAPDSFKDSSLVAFGDGAVPAAAQPEAKAGESLQTRTFTVMPSVGERVEYISREVGGDVGGEGGKRSNGETGNDRAGLTSGRTEEIPPWGHGGSRGGVMAAPEMKEAGIDFRGQEGERRIAGKTAEDVAYERTSPMEYVLDVEPRRPAVPAGQPPAAPEQPAEAPVLGEIPMSGRLFKHGGMAAHEVPRSRTAATGEDRKETENWRNGETEKKTFGEIFDDGDRIPDIWEAEKRMAEEQVAEGKKDKSGAPAPSGAVRGKDAEEVRYRDRPTFAKPEPFEVEEDVARADNVIVTEERLRKADEPGREVRTLERRDWTEFFSKMGVQWPRGAKMEYEPSSRKIVVANTGENLQVFEALLSHLGGQSRSPEGEKYRKEREAQAAVLDKLDKIRISDLDFRQANIQDVVKFLNERSASEVGPDGKAPKIDLELRDGLPDDTVQSGPSGEEVPQLTLKARDVSLKEALKIVSSLGGLKYRVDGNGVKIVPLDEPEGEIEHRIYDVPPDLAEEIEAVRDARRESQETKPSEDDLVGPRFKAFGVNPFVWASAQPFSTFAIDVDTASYTLARNYMLKGFLPPAESVRTEEFVNFFDYGYRPPTGRTFDVYADCAPSRFGRGLHLLKIGVKGRRLGREEQRRAVLTFLIDTSGSMNQPDRLGLVKKSLKMLVDRLAPADMVAIVQYDSHARLVLEHTPASQKEKILAAIDALQCGGSTNLEEGMQRAYNVAARNFAPGGENRVLLLSDGVANLGSMAAEDILLNVEKYRKQGIFCSVFGVGMGAYDDTMLETLANKGDGVYAFVDSEDEARRVFVDDLSATLNTIATDVKIQVEFNPACVARYRQLGYENRQLKKEQFRDDTVDAGEVGSGQSVTALYELELKGDAERDANIGIVRVRYRRVDTGKVEEIERPVRVADVARRFEDADARFRLAAAVAEFAEILRGSPHADGSQFEDVARVLIPAALELGLNRDVQELARLAASASGMARGR